MNFKKMISIAPFGIALALAPCSVAQAQDEGDVVFVAGTGDAAAPADYSDAYQDDTQSYAPLHHRDSSDRIDAMADHIDDPATQDRVSNAVENMGDAVMRMPIGRFAEAIERAAPGTVDRRIHRDSTLGDIAGRDGRDAPARLGYKSREMMTLMGGMMHAVAEIMPELQQWSDEVGAEVDRSVHRRR